MRCFQLWNAAETVERREATQVAREIGLALPTDREVTTEDRFEMARSFAQGHFVSKGLAGPLGSEYDLNSKPTQEPRLHVVYADGAGIAQRPEFAAGDDFGDGEGVAAEHI